jgi:hypothetical protein
MWQKQILAGTFVFNIKSGFEEDAIPWEPGPSLSLQAWSPEFGLRFEMDSMPRAGVGEIRFAGVSKDKCRADPGDFQRMQSDCGE